jgi:hypothetical protein
MLENLILMCKNVGEKVYGNYMLIYNELHEMNRIFNLEQPSIFNIYARAKQSLLLTRQALLIVKKLNSSAHKGENTTTSMLVKSEYNIVDNGTIDKLVQGISRTIDFIDGKNNWWFW